MRNERAANDTRHARTGKDGAFFNKDGVLIATVEQFTSNVSRNNAKYSVLGDAQEHESANTFVVSLIAICKADDELIKNNMLQTLYAKTLAGKLVLFFSEKSFYHDKIPVFTPKIYLQAGDTFVTVSADNLQQ